MFSWQRAVGINLYHWEAMETVSLIIKNADGITPDTSLEEMPIDYSTVGDVKTRLREIIVGGPEESRMKLVFSGRFGCPPLPRYARGQ